MQQQKSNRPVYNYLLPSNQLTCMRLPSSLITVVMNSMLPYNSLEKCPLAEVRNTQRVTLSGSPSRERLPPSYSLRNLDLFLVCERMEHTQRRASEGQAMACNASWLSFQSPKDAYCAIACVWVRGGGERVRSKGGQETVLRCYIQQYLLRSYSPQLSIYCTAVFLVCECVFALRRATRR